MESNKSQTDSAVSPTISAGEEWSPFGDWWHRHSKGYNNTITEKQVLRDKTVAQIAWNARNKQVTALKQELAQAKEEITRLEEVEHYHELFVVDHKRLLNELTSERSARAALEGKLGEMRGAMEEICSMEFCMQEGSCFMPMFDGEGNEIGTQNIDPISTVQQMVETARGALSKCEKTPSAIADGNSPTLGAALEPIKKEGGKV